MRSKQPDTAAPALLLLPPVVARIIGVAMRACVPVANGMIIRTLGCASAGAASNAIR